MSTRHGSSSDATLFGTLVPLVMGARILRQQERNRVAAELQRISAGDGTVWRIRQRAVSGRSRVDRFLSSDGRWTKNPARAVRFYRADAAAKVAPVVGGEAQQIAGPRVAESG